jgi:ABC-type nickel/cobalt efflux system permease component RcnA
VTGTAAVAGLLAGLLHVVSGPDHLAAVLPFSVARPQQSLRVGLFWGLGHGVGVLVLGLLFLVLRDAFDVEAVSARAEALVGLLLVGLGIWAIRKSRFIVLHTHGHGHDGQEHVHPHVHVNDPTVEQADHPVEGTHRSHQHSTFGFGFVHGVAGVGHLLAASPMMAFGAFDAAVYLAAYLAGGIAAMTGFARAAATLVRRPSWVPGSLRAAGAISIGVGLVWLSALV